MFFDGGDDDQPITRGDVRRYRWRSFWAYLAVGIIIMSLILCASQGHSGQINQAQNDFDATSTAADQLIATQENTPLQGPITAAQTYYIAISQQDYTSAYGDLAAGVTYNNKPISQADFVQLAKEKDAKDGRVTKFQVEEGGPYDVTASVQVTRKNGRSYEVSLDCAPKQEEMDGPWAITSFDDI